MKYDLTNGVITSAKEGYVFVVVCLSRCLFVCLLATLRKSFRTDCHEICREVVVAVEFIRKVGNGPMNK